jgi:hypothetical protein
MRATACTESCEQVSRRALRATGRILDIISTSCGHCRTPYQGDIMKTVKKIVLWTLVAFFIFAVFTNPTQAANIVQGAWNIIVQGVSSIGAFFSDILNRN